MFEGVYIPNYFNNKEISSYYLSKIFDNKKFEIKYDDNNSGYFSLELLRNIYKDDKKMFQIMTLELFLRGFYVKTNKPTNMFPDSFVKENSEVISICENNKKIDIKKIDFKLLHIDSFLDIFKVESSDFFKNIPLEGFLSVNQYVNLGLVKSEFSKAGYQIKETDLLIQEKRVEILNQDKKKQDIFFEPKILKEIRERNYLHIIDIAEIMPEYNDGFIYLKQNNINFVHDLTEREMLKIYFERPDLYSELIVKINKNLNTKKITFYLIEIFKVIYSTGKYIDNLIFTIFEENKFNLLKNHLYKNNVFLSSEFTPDIFIQYTESNNVGLKRIFDTVDVVVDYYDKENKQDIPNLYLSEKVVNNVGILRKVYISFFLCTHPDWLKYLKENKQDTFSDKNNLAVLLNEIEISLKNKRKIVKEIKNEVKLSISSIQNLEIEKMKIELDLYDKLSNRTPLEILSIVGLDTTYLEQEKESYLIEVNDMINQPLYKIEELIINGSYENKQIDILSLFKNIVWIIQQSFNSIDTIEEMMLHDMKDSELIVYNQRMIEGKTLQEVGEIAGVTRERIRQIEKKLTNRIFNKFESLVNPGIKLYLSTVKEGLLQLKDLSFPVIVKHNLMNGSQDIGYFKNFDFIYLKTESNKKIISELDFIMKNIPLIVSREKLISMISSNELFPSYIANLFIRNLDSIIQSYRYFAQDELLIFETINLEQRVHYIASMFSRQSIDISRNEDLTHFRNKYERIFPESNYLDCNNELLARKMRGTLERSSRFIMTRAATFMIYDYRLYSQKIINDIYEYLIDYFEEDIVINYKKVYSIFEIRLSENKITPHMMYYILKYNFSDFFNFGKGNTMNIFLKDIEKLTTEEIFYNKVDANGGSIKRTFMISEFGYEEYTVDQTVSNSTRLTSLEGLIQITDFDLKKIPQKLIEAIKTVSSESLSEYRFISIEKIFYKLKFDDELAALMLESNIKEPRSLLNIVKMIYPEMQGHTKFLYGKDDSLDNSDVILSNFKIGEKFTRADIFDEGKKLGYAESTISMYVKKWRIKSIIILIKEDLFVLPGSVQISNEGNEKLKAYLDDILTNKKYLALYNIKGFRRKLPVIQSYSWTPELISYLGKKEGYSSIVIEAIAHTFDPLIILNPNYPNLTYRDLLIEAMENYHSNLYEKNVCNYLIELGLVVQRKNPLQELPEEVLAEQVIRVNEIGIVERIEVR